MREYATEFQGLGLVGIREYIVRDYVVGIILLHFQKHQ